MLNRAVNRLLERGLAESPRARELCALLADRTLAILVPGLPWELHVHSTGTALQVSTVAAATATPGPVSGSSPDAGATTGVTTGAAGTGGCDARIHGGVLSLLALAGSDAQHVIQRGEVRMDGDIDVAQRFRELALLLRPDIEAALAQVTGAMPAHLLAGIAQRSLDWGRNSARTALTNVVEYLMHERGALVSRAEAEQFLHGVDTLREQLDRAEARVHTLEATDGRRADRAGSAR